jgi:hypothetical protein
VDQSGNDVRTINQLKPLVQRCAFDLRTRLSRNEFPELLATIEQYGDALSSNGGRGVEWGEIWGLGVMLQNAASAAERQITQRLLPPLEDSIKSSLESLLMLHGPLILATCDGSKLAAIAQSFAMAPTQQADFRTAAERVAQQLMARRDVITRRAAASVEDAVKTAGEGSHPTRGSVYALATIKNVSIVLLGGAAAATPAMMGAFLGSTILGTLLGSPITLLALEAVKKSPSFSALVTMLGAKLDTMSDLELREWLEERGRRFAPFRSFVISNEGPLRKIAEATLELKWMMRYIDFVVNK